MLLAERRGWYAIHSEREARSTARSGYSDQLPGSKVRGFPCVNWSKNMQSMCGAGEVLIAFQRVPLGLMLPIREESVRHLWRFS